MNIMLFPHHPKCTADYPEKPKGEKAQLITKIDIGNGEIVYQCVDCGASILTKEKIKEKIKEKEKNNDKLK